MDDSIRTRHASLHELAPDDRDLAGRWLSPGERATYESLRAIERRATFLAGRMAAKQLVMECLEEGDGGAAAARPMDIHIETRSSDRRRGDRPVVSVRGRRFRRAMSIAHTAKAVLVAVAGERGVRIGVDLVRQDDRRLCRLTWCFTERERRWLAAAPGRTGGELWALKEALYKACQAGEGFAPARIDVAPDVAPSYPNLRGVVRSLRRWHVDGHVAALAVVDAPDLGGGETASVCSVLSRESVDD